MAKALITQSYLYPLDKKQWKNKQPYPPLGTLYASSILRNQGHEITFFDNGLQSSSLKVNQKLKEGDFEYLIIYEDGFNYLTKMCLTKMREVAFDILKQAKILGVKTIISSSDATDHGELYIQNGADYVIDGEADDTIAALLECLKNKGPLESISGIIYLNQNQGIQKTEKRAVISNLDEIPFPAWDLLDIKPYEDIWKSEHGYFSLNMSTTRGCPYKCNWCAKPIYGNRYNTRSVENVIEEIKILQNQFHIDHFWMCDDIFGLKASWVKEFAAQVVKKELKFKFKIQSRADLLLKEDNIRDLAIAGCDEVWIGAESGSQKILDAMDKGTSVEQIEEATKLLKKAGIRPCFFIQFGYLGESNEDICKTIQMMDDLAPHDIGISVSYPLPGTKFYERVQKDLKGKSNWTDSDDLEMMFQGTYDTKTYKILHKFIHKRFRLKQCEKKIKSQLNLKELALQSIKISYYSVSKYIYGYKLKKCKIHL